MADPDIAPAVLRRCPRCQQWKRQTREFFAYTSTPANPGVWSPRCKLCVAEVNLARYHANPEPTKARTRQWVRDHADHSRVYQREWAVQARAKLKAEMIAAYGSRCDCCGLSEFANAFLTLEHKNRDGAAHRKRLGGQEGVVRELKRLGWPTDSYCLLCWNCQLSSWYGGACAHTPDYRPSQPKHRAHRDAVIAAYGGCCDCCALDDQPFLCVEHVNQDGKAHRLATGGNVYRDLIKQGFPPGITILCYNCQMARAFHGCCPHERDRQLALGLGDAA